MKHYHCVQGKDEWLRLRMGKPTASEFDRLITPAKKETKTGEILGWQPTKGETRRNYAIYLITELILDMPLSGANTASMQHGTAWEQNARAAYEASMGVDVVECGFCTNDEGTYGASPDAFVGEDGSLELKSPAKPEIHVARMVNPDVLVEEYFVQTQGQLFVTEKKWTDLVSHFGGLPMVRVRVVPDPEFQTRLGVAVRQFCAEVSDLVERCLDKGWLKESPALTGWIQEGDIDMVRKGSKKTAPQGDFDISDEEIERIWAKTQVQE